MIRLLPLIVALAATLGWSDPIPIVTTATPISPAVAAVGGRVHVFWLDRPSPTAPAGDLWHAVLTPEGRVTRPPSKLRGAVDTRLAVPVAVAWAGRIAAAWMARAADGVTTEIAVLSADGAVQTIVRPDPVRREEGGRIALAASPGGVLHAAWSQFDGGARAVWYTRLEPGGRVRPPIRLATGDAPALMLDPDPRLFWWEPAGAVGFRLLTGIVGPDGVTRRRSLTGTIALVAPLPVLPAALDTGSILLIPTLERTFSTAGRLYAMRLGGGSDPPPRMPLLGEAPVSDVAVAQGSGSPVAMWSQAVGRRQNSELFAARLGRGERLLEPASRLTYTIPGSLKPGVVVVEDAPAAVWLEVAGFGQFSITYGTSAHPRRHRFFLAIPELDLYRPGGLLAFAVLTVISVLPIAALLMGATLLPSMLVVLMAQMIVAPFSRLDEWLRRSAGKAVVTLAVTLAIQVAGRALIPSRPDPALLAVPMVAVGLPVVVWLVRRGREDLAAGLLTAAVVLVEAVVVLFPWGAAQLTQL